MLSPREKEIVGLVALGQQNKVIAQSLGISPETVKGHIDNARLKFRAPNRAALAAMAVREGLA